MQPRIDYATTAPGVAKAMLGLEEYVHHTGLEPGLLELVRLRASLINGCAYCVDMYTKVARSLGETEQRLYSVSVWREAPYYTERERAALAWTEAVTLVSGDHVPDEVYETARQHFPDKELIDLTLAIVAINGWNRLAVAFRTVPGRSKWTGGHRTDRPYLPRRSRRLAETMWVNDDHDQARL